MHELFGIQETLPVDPGSSPFNVRGMYYNRILEHARTLPGGTQQFLDEIADPRVREFMGQRFKFMDWYDALPTLPAQVALARIRGGDFEAFIRERSRLYMERLIPSMFRLLPKLGSPRAAASHSSRLLRTYFDFVEHSLDKVTDSSGSGTVTGIPLYLAPVTLNAIIGTLTGALESLGATDIRAEYDAVRITGRKLGFEILSCHVSFSWTLQR